MCVCPSFSASPMNTNMVEKRNTGSTKRGAIVIKNGERWGGEMVFTSQAEGFREIEEQLFLKTEGKEIFRKTQVNMETILGGSP